VTAHVSRRVCTSGIHRSGNPLDGLRRHLLLHGLSWRGGGLSGGRPRLHALGRLLLRWMAGYHALLSRVWLLLLGWRLGLLLLLLLLLPARRHVHGILGHALRLLRLRGLLLPRHLLLLLLALLLLLLHLFLVSVEAQQNLFILVEGLFGHRQLLPYFAFLLLRVATPLDGLLQFHNLRLRLTQFLANPRDLVADLCTPRIDLMRRNVRRRDPALLRLGRHRHVDTRAATGCRRGAGISSDTTSARRPRRLLVLLLLLLLLLLL
jgi:hypothetical protein